MKHLFKALADFQQEVPVIHKATKGYGYTYADLATIYPIINPILKKNGLGFTQLVDNAEIHTIVFHSESGEILESKTPIPQNVDLKGQNDFQTLGSAITYIRRYALSAILGIVTDKDTDAGGVQKPKEKALKPLTEDDINNLIIQLESIETREALTKLYNQDVRFKTNEEVMILFKEKSEDLKANE